jgi:predicted DNA-binding transcriptional regulator YafY
MLRAVQHRRCLLIRYWTASRDEVTKRVIDPYHLTTHGGGCYLAAFCHLREEVRLFALSRIRSARETGETFDRPYTFSLGEFLDGSFGVIRGGEKVLVRLRFGPVAARYVREKKWHKSQKLVELPHGGLELQMWVSQSVEVKRWILSYGPGCEVLEPAELRSEVADELREALGKYTEAPNREEPI